MALCSILGAPVVASEGLETPINDNGATDEDGREAGTAHIYVVSFDKEAMIDEMKAVVQVCFVFEIYLSSSS